MRPIKENKGRNLRIQQESIQYIRDNRLEVTKNNQKTLVILNSFYFVVLIFYYISSLTVFKSWNVTTFYLIVVIIQAVMQVIVLIRYKNKVRSWEEVNIACSVFQLYAMFFVAIMSIVPVEMNQPAVYFAPIGMAFVASFVFTYQRALVLVTVEMGGYLVASFLTKSRDVFAIDACSTLLAFFMAYFLARIMYTQRIRENESRQRIKRMGRIDSLTGLYNKASTEFLCKGYMKSKPLQDCVVMILDFDNFKFVNDTYGHQAGDAILRSFGRILKREADEDHVAGRIGGDEFLMFLKDASPLEAEAMAVRILNKTRTLVAPDGTNPFSCSIGIAGKRVNKNNLQNQETYKELFARADQALYQVKENGKNNYMIQS